MDEATVHAIGELPKGRGVLGALIETPSRSGCAGYPTMSALPGSRRVIRR